jgi:hypothetical protein
MSARAEEKTHVSPSLSILALISFVASFAIARTFTILRPQTTLNIHHIHIHHYWYGVALLAIGGWLGISYKSDRLARFAAILFGAGGGILGDEAGYLLTNNYWTIITYTLVIVFLTLVCMLALFLRYSRVIVPELAGLTRRRLSVYFSLFLAVVSLMMIMETSNIMIITVSGALATVSCLFIVAYVVQYFTKKR